MAGEARDSKNSRVSPFFADLLIATKSIVIDERGVRLKSGDERLDELESKLVFQERALDQLNEVLLDQERRLQALELRIRNLGGRLDGPEDRQDLESD